MKHTNQLIVIAIITNMLILVPAGHGIGVMIILEFMLFSSGLWKELVFVNPGGYTGGSIYIPASALLSMLGQLLLIIGLFQRNHRKKKAWSLAGLLAGAGGLIYYVGACDGTALAMSIPYIFLFLLLLARILFTDAEEAA
ncbi:hypothetical protein [Chitinophaga barathri]|uniref:Uncharacterized protein n=1 Tax=Chitinophaga barathri TaxID=1647451 RepID=A0A3N4M526_9BACT|nr:hypothetical protein [Chitinophaga barathri]RPD38262.1 hypothetical protein EG028_25540 [Chitinophaga barathri]